ncbi:MAG: hypothetical protein HRT57_09280 [Crocinitomicaceae bacterium]|nr:hypothetical protein [Crocinitomicaceae bacterium]
MIRTLLLFTVLILNTLYAEDKPVQSTPDVELPDPRTAHTESLKLLNEGKIIEYFRANIHSEELKMFNAMIEKQGEAEFTAMAKKHSLENLLKNGECIKTSTVQYYESDTGEKVAYCEFATPVRTIVGVNFYLDNDEWKLRKKGSNVSATAKAELVESGKIK